MLLSSILNNVKAKRLFSIAHIHPASTSYRSSVISASSSTMPGANHRANRTVNQRTRSPGASNLRTRPRAALANVPTVRQVITGAPVSIVMKADQPSGRQVQGFVDEVLTRGNHPRGIKVRLADGRVGRVQGMITEDEAIAGAQGRMDLGRNGEVIRTNSAKHYGTSSSGSSSTRFTHLYRDSRLQEPIEGPSGYGFDELLPDDHPLKASQSKKAPEGEAVDRDQEGSSTQVCPVCETFQGDAYAISRHVDEHFK